MKKIAISGGAPVALCDISGYVVGASWGVDDIIVYSDYPKGIKRVSANGGTPEVIVKEGPAYDPQLLPDGKSLLLTFTPTPYKIIVQSLQSGERKELFAGDIARYLPTGHIVYGMGDNLLAVPFDLKTLKVTGGAVPVVEGVWRATVNHAPQYAVSDTGTLVYIPGAIGSLDQRTLAWVDRKGKETPISPVPNNYAMPRISPDGTKVALSIVSGPGNRSDIWTLDLVHETMTRLTFNEVSDCPLWTLDGKRVVFLSGKFEKSEIYWKAADGTGQVEKLGSEQPWQVPWSWSADGKTLLLTQVTIGGGIRYFIGTLSTKDDHTLKPLLQEIYNEREPKISPDGRWLAYSSEESGKAEIYVRPFPEVNKGKWQVSASGGADPLWSPDGRELFYRNGDSAMAAVVQTATTFRRGKTETLFQGTYVSSWDISRDGKQFLMIKPPAPTGAAPTAANPQQKINIVVNWFEELKQRVPVK